MAYIYKIENDINGKLYIGQTTFSLEIRFQQHISDSKKGLINRPLYAAMQKYGFEHFHIQLIEETNNPNEREQFWIRYYDTYKNGYNATIGGEGKSIIDKKEIYDIWIKNNRCSMLELSKITGHDNGQLGVIIKSMGGELENGKFWARKKQGKSVLQLNKDTGEVIAEYKCLADAERAMNVTVHKSHIGQVCNGKRKTTLGYKWRWK